MTIDTSDVQTFLGPQFVEFTNGRVRKIDVEGFTRDVNGWIMLLVGTDGKIYNFNNIIGMKKEKPKGLK
jgi:hypothetical protein